MAITWLLQKDAETPATLAALGVTACVLNLKANGVDSLSFTVSGDFIAAAAFPFGCAVALIRRDSAASPADKCVFKGTVESVPRQAVGGATEDVQYIALGPAYALQRCDFSQDWSYTSSGGSVTSITEPTVVLGEDSAGTRLRSGAMIASVADYAISRGVGILKGAVAAGVWTPYDERTNITCWDAIVAMLRYTPDYVLWFDYNTTSAGVYVPTLRVTAPADMAVATKAVADLTTAAFTPRLDLQVPGIQIIYRWTGEYDGRTVKSRSVDTAGTYNAARRVSLVYDLEGSRSSFISQAVEVEDYPSDWTSAAAKAFIAARIPWLSQLADADWSVDAVARSGAELYPSVLKSGCVPSWTGEHTEPETFTIDVMYQIKSPVAPYGVLDKGMKRLTFSATSTDATSKTYRKQTEWVEAEPVPADLAANLYASWNRLHYDGQISYEELEASFDVVPGMLLRVTGGLTEWATMDAVVQDVSIDIATGAADVSVGTCGRLEADNLLSIYRAARGRRYSYLRLGRDSGDATDGNAIDGASGTPNDTVADGTPASERQRFAVEAENPTDALSHRIDLAPELVEFAVGTDKAAQTIQPRELLVIVGAAEGGGYLIVKRVQILASGPYGTTINIPVGQSAGGAEVAAAGSIEDAGGELRLKGDANIPTSGLPALYLHTPGSTPVWQWIRLRSPLFVDTAGDTDYISLKGVTDTPPATYSVYCKDGSTAGYGFVEPFILDLS